LKNKIDAVITSPPYLNGTNYFRNTKLELWFLSYLKTEDDLRLYRDEALTSGINDVKQEYSKQVNNMSSPLLDQTMELLDKQAYDRRIPLMARCYFKEMQEVFHGLTKNLNDGADILVDLGDSIFSNVHIKTDLILLEIIAPLGFKLKSREILRQRRSRNGALLSQVLLVIKYKEA
jgi:DNA modification methylase